MTDPIKLEDYLSIGELSRLTGIGVHTLRVWEKRYGAPNSERLPSGHRRYPKEEVPRLRAIARALESGYRASKVVTGTLEELQGLLGVQTFLHSGSEEAEPETGQVSRELVVEQWIDAVHHYNDETLAHSFYKIWNKEGPLHFILDYAAPFVERIGDGWVNGELSVGQEHFATSHLSDFLSSKWRQLNVRKDGPCAVLSTLPDETHNLGLLMCAVVAGLADYRIVYLGPNSPVDDIVKTVDDCDAQLLCLSISNCVDARKAVDRLAEIKSRLNSETTIALGGRGAPPASKGMKRFNTFKGFYEWLVEQQETA
ncbi:MAG: MerR family transcriptional regulator [Candidatus Nitrohelix vancouverensis]|uniref:MerR family transcriptional regulator n=1 Tax=Candidatus Nitrohelix vancouverensis TaxID=2705534 RepID=A0A7T0C1A2_9BACT|nr:MAG: MerR family transcriptional regulator [Candidatus Nitrohelix vancouverensis]